MWVFPFQLHWTFTGYVLTLKIVNSKLYIKQSLTLIVTNWNGVVNIFLTKKININSNIFTKQINLIEQVIKVKRLLVGRGTKKRVLLIFETKINTHKWTFWVKYILLLLLHFTLIVYQNISIKVVHTVNFFLLDKPYILANSDPWSLACRWQPSTTTS